MRNFLQGVLFWINRLSGQCSYAVRNTTITAQDWWLPVDVPLSFLNMKCCSIFRISWAHCLCIDWIHLIPSKGSFASRVWISSSSLNMTNVKVGFGGFEVHQFYIYSLMGSPLSIGLSRDFSTEGTRLWSGVNWIMDRNVKPTAKDVHVPVVLNFSITKLNPEFRSFEHECSNIRAHSGCIPNRWRNLERPKSSNLTSGSP